MRLALPASDRCAPVSLNTSQLSIVPNASRPSARRLGHRRLVVEQPAHLGGREIGIEQQPGRRAHRVLVPGLAQRVAELGGAPVLPDQRAGERLAGPLVPRDHGLALVGHADRGDALGAAGQRDHLARAFEACAARSRRRRARPSPGADSAASARAAPTPRGSPAAVNSIARVEVVPSSRTRISGSDIFIPPRDMGSAPYAGAWRCPRPTLADRHWLRTARAAGPPRAGAERLAVHLHRHADLPGRHRAGPRGDRSRPGPARAPRRARGGDRRGAGHGDLLHPHPPRPFARRRARSRRAPARRSSAALRWCSRATSRAPTCRSTPPIAPTACWPTAKRMTGPGWTLTARRHARAHLEPLVLRARGKRRAVHRRPRDGLVDHRGRPARRRHGRLHGQPRQAPRPRRPRLLSRRTARRSTNPRQLVRGMIGHRRQRETADPQAARHRRARE